MATTTTAHHDAPAIDSPDHITVWGRFEIEYEMRQPDPSHWAAIGTVTMRLNSGAATTALELVVGTGRSEAEAVCDLRSRVMQKHIASPRSYDDFADDWLPTFI